METLDDLMPGMVLEGAVTNVAAFGAFVDIGVHQDGLVHVSAMAKTFVKDPREIVKPGDIVRVKVLDVDKPRKRIAFTLRLGDEVGRNPGGAGTATARTDAGPRTPRRAKMSPLRAARSPTLCAARALPPTRTGPTAPSRGSRLAHAPQQADMRRHCSGAGLRARSSGPKPGRRRTTTVSVRSFARCRRCLPRRPARRDARPLKADFSVLTGSGTN